MFCHIHSVLTTFALCVLLWPAGLSAQGVYLFELQWKTPELDKSIGVQGPHDNLSVMKWKDDFRRLLDPPKSEAQRKKELVDESAAKKSKRALLLRTNATVQDQASGEALNAICLVLLDPKISANSWRDSRVALPKDAFKEIFFRYQVSLSKFSPISNSKQFSIATVKPIDIGSWPRSLAEDVAVKSEFIAFKEAFKANIESLKELDPNHPSKTKAFVEAVKSLDEAVKKSIPNSSNARAPSIQYLNSLEQVVPSLEYVYAMRKDSSGGVPESVEELVLFMLKYRLQFAAANGSRSTDIYGELYNAFREQLHKLSPAPTAETIPLVEVDLVDKFKNWKFTGDAKNEFAFSDDSKAIKTFGKTKRENATGVASLTFVVPGNATFLVFEVEGGNRPQGCKLQLISEGKEVQSATGNRKAGDGQAPGTHDRKKWNIASFRGKSVTFEIADHKVQDKKGEVFCYIAFRDLHLE